MAGGEDPATGPRTRVDHETVEPDDEPGPSRSEWLKRGQSIDRYLVIECLGVGGMGVIYAAWDPQLDRKLAIKVVRGRRGRRGSARARARLLREAQALARLRHPNVVAVHDVGEYEDRVFVAMEFVAGETLQRWLLRSPRPPTAELIRVFLQVGRGLAAAHRAGIVHRDVKPENVMVGEDGRVLVLDFGIAREGYGSESDVIVPEGEGDPLADPDRIPSTEIETGAEVEVNPDPLDLDEALADELGLAGDEELSYTPLSTLTRTGAVIGTPAYMSPEQHRGQTVDARGDQFSFCVAMWEALHGEKPFGEGARQKLLARMRVGQFRRPHNRDVPRRINKALARGLAWHPGDRFPQMEDLLEALNPRGATAEQRLWHGLGLGALGGLALGVATTLLSGASVDRAQAPIDASAGPEPGVESSPGSASLDLREALARLETRSRREGVALELDALERIRLGARETGDHWALSRVLLLEARGARELGRDEQAWLRALEAADAAAAAHSPSLEAQAWLSAVLVASEASDEARLALRHASALLDGLPRADPLHVDQRIAASHIAHLDGHLQRARHTLLEARDRAVSEANSRQHVEILHRLARVSLTLGLDQRGVDSLREAARLAKPASIPTWAIELDLGRGLERLGQAEAAGETYALALASVLELLGPGPASARLRLRIAALEATAEACAEGWSPPAEALADARRPPIEQDLLAQTLESLALACSSSHPQALDFAREALELRRRLHRPEDPRITRARAIEALALLSGGQAEAARALVDTSSPPVPLPAPPLMNLARGLVLVEQGQRAEARAALTLALETLDAEPSAKLRAAAALARLDEAVASP